MDGTMVTMTIKPYQKNAKKHPKDQLAKIAASIQRFGFRQPVVVDKYGTIIVGHGRYEAARKVLGWRKEAMAPFSAKGDETIPYVLADDLSPDEIAAYRLADNKLNESEWDMELVGAELEALPEDLKLLTGFSDILDIEPEEDGYDGEAPAIPRSKPGDLYELGEHRLLCGDATKAEDLATLMADDRAAMVFTDPPYNIAYEGGMSTHAQNKREMIMNDKMSPEAFLAFLTDSIGNMMAYCDGAMYVCMSSSELVSLKRAFEDVGGHFQSFIIWAKNTFTLSRSDWQNQYEPILYGWRDGVVNHYFVGHRNLGNVWKYEPTDEELLKWAREAISKELTDVWDEKKPTKSKEHPTMKPIALVGRALHASSQKDDVVLDAFGGSGSTLIACEQMGRACRTMELDPKYCDVIVDRWEKLTGKKAELRTK